MAGPLPWVTAGDRRLLRLLAAPEGEVERLWRAWQAAADLDTLPWSSVRLAAAAIGRLGRLGRRERHGPRLLGVRRYCWSNGQHKLAAVRPVLEAFVAAGIPTLLLKGGAALAAGDAEAGERYIADIDLLVPPARCDEALDLLARAAWRPQSGGRIARVRGRELPRHHAVNLVDGGEGEIDLHWCLLKENRAAGDDDAVWHDAEAVRFGGVGLLVPAPHHRLLQALAQGAQWSSGNALDWAADSLALLRRPALRLDALLAEVERRQLVGQTGLALRVLRDEAGCALPPPLATLAEQPVAEPWRGEVAAGLVAPGERDRAQRAAVRRAASLRRAAAARDGRRSLFAERLEERRLALPGLRRLLARGAVPLRVEPLPEGGARLRLPEGRDEAEAGALLLRLEAPADRSGACRVEAGGESAWVGRWRLPRGRACWRGARLTAEARAALAAGELLVESFRELRRPPGGDALLPLDDGPVSVLKALLLP